MISHTATGRVPSSAIAERIGSLIATRAIASARNKSGEIFRRRTSTHLWHTKATIPIGSARSGKRFRRATAVRRGRRIGDLQRLPASRHRQHPRMWLASRLCSRSSISSSVRGTRRPDRTGGATARLVAAEASSFSRFALSLFVMASRSWRRMLRPAKCSVGS